MPQYGSSQNLISTNLSQTVDNQGNPIISSDTGFAASPLGYAARAQALFGLPNSTFELTPPDTTAVISAANPLPYWDVQDYSSGVMSGSAIYDETTNSWGVNLNPGTADTDDYITMTTRSYLINDSNLSLRQQALAVVSKVGTYAGTTQWNLELTAAYYDLTNTLLHSGTVATIYDNTTWTSMAGTTTTGGTAISASAHYVDLQFKLLATAPVTSATSVTIKSCLLQTSSGGGGGAQSFLVTETFTSSGTWTRPTGVDYLVAVVGLGAGGGGSRGALTCRTSSLGTAAGGAGGGGGPYAILRDVYVGGVASISVGIGAGGVGGTANSFFKPAAPNAGSASTYAEQGGGGGDGGNTTFGTFLLLEGGLGASRQPGEAESAMFDWSWSRAGTGANDTTGSAGSVGNPGGSAAMAAFSQLSYLSAGTAAGVAGATGSVTFTGSGQIEGTASGGAGGGTGYGGGGGGGGKSTQSIAYVGGAGGANGSGGGGGAASWEPLTTGGTATIKGGDGGNAAPYSGAGGGGGGGATAYGSSTPYNLSQITIASGKGGDGATGVIYVIYVA
jgi:hypothetical protein